MAHIALSTIDGVNSELASSESPLFLSPQAQILTYRIP